MKITVYIITLFSIVFGGCTAPSEKYSEPKDETYKLDSICSSYLGPQRIYRYDKSGNLIYRGTGRKDPWFVKDEYNESNRLKRRYYHLETDWIEENIYDTWGNLIATYSYDISGTDTTLLSKDEYSYDSLCRVTREVTMIMKDSECINCTRVEKEYDKGKKPICEVFYVSKNIDSSVPTGKFIYIYTDKDSLESRIYFKYKDGKWVQDQKFEYAYNDKGHITKEECKNWRRSKTNEDAKQWMNSSKTEYEYDERGNMTRLKEVYWKEVQWECISSLEKVYNENSELISSYWVRDEITQYDYDHNLNSSQIIMPAAYFDGDFSPKTVLHSAHPMLHVYSRGDTITFYYSPLQNK